MCCLLGFEIQWLLRARVSDSSHNMGQSERRAFASPQRQEERGSKTGHSTVPHACVVCVTTRVNNLNVFFILFPTQFHLFPNKNASPFLKGHWPTQFGKAPKCWCKANIPDIPHPVICCKTSKYSKYRRSPESKTQEKKPVDHQART